MQMRVSFSRIPGVPSQQTLEARATEWSLAKMSMMLHNTVQIPNIRPTLATGKVTAEADDPLN